MKPIRIAIACPDTEVNGTDFHRLISPMWSYATAPDFEVERCADIIGLTQKQLDGLDFLIVSRHLTRLPNGMPRAKAMIKNSPCKLIVDIDDYWHLPTEHPGSATWMAQGGGKAMLETMKIAHAIWTTTSKLKTAIDALNNRATCYVVANRINRHDPQWATACIKKPSVEIRLGVVAIGSAWMNLIELNEGIRAMNAQPFWRIKAIGVDDAHRNHVKMLLGTDRIDFLPWASPFEYAAHYRDIDLMLCPLMRNDFNKYRSPIKILECSRTGTAILAENYGPYQGVGQIEHRGWNALPQIVSEMLNKPPHIAPSTDPHLFSEKPDTERMETMRKLLVR